VIADICHDLGIVPVHPLWGEVMMIVTEFGGSIVKLIEDVIDRLCFWIHRSVRIPGRRVCPASVAGLYGVRYGTALNGLSA
jgi:hypothetical protein